MLRCKKRLTLSTGPCTLEYAPGKPSSPFFLQRGQGCPPAKHSLWRGSIGKEKPCHKLLLLLLLALLLPVLSSWLASQSGWQWNAESSLRQATSPPNQKQRASAPRSAPHPGQRSSRPPAPSLPPPARAPQRPLPSKNQQQNAMSPSPPSTPRQAATTRPGYPTSPEKANAPGPRSQGSMLLRTAIPLDRTGRKQYPIPGFIRFLLRGKWGARYDQT